MPFVSLGRFCRSLLPILAVIALLLSQPNGAAAQNGRKAKEQAGMREYRSQHFLMRTDIASQEAAELLKKLETMIGLISKYWGRPMSGTVECYVVRDLANFPVDSMDAHGVAQIRAGAGLTVTLTISSSERFAAKSVIYACDKDGVVQHEAVHAYCGHAFGRTGPTWYAEGMAEMGQYWRDNDRSVNAHPYVIKYLRSSPPKSLVETVAPFQATGDSWQNYAWRWALCHLLANNPNYSAQFQPLGIGLLTGKNVSFEQVYGSVAKEISFEYLFFLQHADTGFRVDLCAWDWKKKSLPMRAMRTVGITVQAGRGWQPTGLTVDPGVEYDYAASGLWKTAKDRPATGPDGDSEGRGRLVGVLKREDQLSREFELGTSGTLKFSVDGDLYVRCRDAWNEIADNSGKVSLKLRLKRGVKDPGEKDPGEKDEPQETPAANAE